MTPTILIPISQFQHGFTTCPAIDVSNVELVTLDDKELGVHKVSNRTPHPIVQPPEQTAGISKSVPSSLPVPTSSWLAHYPKGSINPSASLPGGFGFYANGPSKFSAALADATETVMSYRMMLDKDWDGNKGGKLPGICEFGILSPFHSLSAFSDGGVGALAYGCTGGRKENRCSCFNIRLMWRYVCLISMLYAHADPRENSVGELYVYMPPTENNRIQLLSVPPLSVGNAEYGFSVGRGSFNFTPGAWMSVSIGIKLNDLGVENGKSFSIQCQHREV